VPVSPNAQTAKWRVVTPPTSLPVTSFAVETHLRLQPSTEPQTYIDLLVQAATDFAEESMATSLMPRTLCATFYGREPIVLPRGPIISIASIVDAGQTAVSNYTLQNVGRTTRVVPAAAVDYPVSVMYEAGYVAGRIPPSIKLAILAHVATLYEHRESVGEKAMAAIPHSLQAFYRLHSRKVGIA
jgi:uncharacterized phiE125 gp8 family phage protein